MEINLRTIIVRFKLSLILQKFFDFITNLLLINF